MRLLAVVLFSFVSACAAAAPILTPSGKPECTVACARSDEVQSQCLEGFVADGWMLKSQTSNQLVFWKENQSDLQNVLMGSDYDPTTTHEVRLVFTSHAGETRVLGQVALVTNEGSAFEQRNDLTSGKAGYELWQALDRMARRFESNTDSTAMTTANPTR